MMELMKMKRIMNHMDLVMKLHDEDLSNELYKSNIVYDLFTHKYIQLHIFQKKYSFKNKIWLNLR